MTFSDYIKFWFEQLGLSSGELALLAFVALVFSPLPRLFIVLSAIRLGFNGFPGKFVSVALALAISLVQMEPVLQPIVGKIADISKGVIGAEQRSNFLKFSEIEWNKYIEERTYPRFKDKIGEIPSVDSNVNYNVRSTIGHRAVPFLLSELDRAFRMALVIILPLIIIELLVGTAISALDLEIETELISFPLKLTLFLSTSGWALITETLLKLH